MSSRKWGLSLLAVFVSLAVLEAATLLTNDQRDTAIGGIEGYPEVVSASIGQADNHLYLVVVVKPDTSLDVARNMGDNFVRMVKTFGPDSSPGKVIGRGKHHYHVKVKVTSPTIKTIASGYKSNDDTGINWE